MQASAIHRDRIAPGASTTGVLAALSVLECDLDMPLMSIPRPEPQLVVRFGPSTRRGLDVHMLGVRQEVHRKLIRRGQRSVTARLHLGASASVLGAPACAIAGRIVPLEDLWGTAATLRLVDRLADAHDLVDAAAVIESAIAERIAASGAHHVRTQLARDAAARLPRVGVNAVAMDLGVSERHLRRVFREAVGLSPKAFARLTRFRRALRAAREDGQAGWACIAAEAGYYDQAHLIAEFRAIAGATPRALIGELRSVPPID